MINLINRNAYYNGPRNANYDGSIFCLVPIVGWYKIFKLAPIGTSRDMLKDPLKPSLKMESTLITITLYR